MPIGADNKDVTEVTINNELVERVTLDGDLVFRREPNNPFDINAATFDTSITAASGFPGDLVIFAKGGSRLYQSGPKTHRFDLSTPFEITNAQKVGAGVDLPRDNDENSVAFGMAFNNDGSRIYHSVRVNSDNRIYQSNLNENFDISTVINEEFITQNNSQLIRDVHFNNDGSTLYELDEDGRIFQHELNTTFDIKSINNTVSESFPVQALSGMAFNDDGSRLYTTVASDSEIVQYELQNNFDVTTKTREASIPTQSANPTGIVFDDIGARMYELNLTGDEINQYKIL